MRKLCLLFISLFFFALNILTSHLIATDVRKVYSESYLLLNKAILIGFPRDFHFAISNINFVNSLSFIGYALEKGHGRITKNQAYKLYSSLDTTTTYNPRYFDPYYVANSFLTWDVGLYEEALALLMRGLRYVNDWRIPFYIGFIYFYFLEDNLKGAEYLRLAVKYSQAKGHNILPLLASRLYYEEGKYELAIALLEEQLKVIKNEGMKKVISARLMTLKRAYRIKKAMKIFKRRFGRYPQNIAELEDVGLIPKGLTDSAGGRFYITSDGKVRSEKILLPLKRKILEEKAQRRR